MDYEIIKVRAFDGTDRMEAAVEVFNTATGAVLAIVRRALEEPRQDWINRAFAQAAAA